MKLDINQIFKKKIKNIYIKNNLFQYQSFNYRHTRKEKKWLNEQSHGTTNKSSQKRKHVFDSFNDQIFTNIIDNWLIDHKPFSISFCFFFLGPSTFQINKDVERVVDFNFTVFFFLNLFFNHLYSIFSRKNWKKFYWF